MVNIPALASLAAVICFCLGALIYHLYCKSDDDASLAPVSPSPGSPA